MSPRPGCQVVSSHVLPPIVAPGSSASHLLPPIVAPGSSAPSSHLLPPIVAPGSSAHFPRQVSTGPYTARDDCILPPIAPTAPSLPTPRRRKSDSAVSAAHAHATKYFDLASNTEFSGTVKHAMLDFNANSAAPRLVSIIKAFLERQEGSSLKAWLRHFDKNNDRRISLDEFVNGMHKLNYKGDIGDIKNAFSILDSDGSGELTLEEIDVEQYKLWKSFCSWCTTIFESPEDMCSKIRSTSSSRTGETPSVIPSPTSPSAPSSPTSPPSPTAPSLPASPSPPGVASVCLDDLTLSRETFIQGLEGLGWSDGHEDLIYHSLDLSDAGVIEPKNLQWLELEKKKIKNRESAKRKAVNANSKKSLAVTAAALDRRKLDAALHDFKVFLKRKYGNYVRAWRRALSNGSLVLQKHELFNGCNKVGWRGDMRLLWTALDKDNNGCIAIEELDMKGAELLAHFHKCIMEHFGSASVAFRSFDKQNMKKLRMEDFEAGLRQCGFKFPVKPIYQGLDFEGHKFVTEQDFQILQNWKPPAFLSAAANPGAAEEFKKCLLEEHGSHLKAWRLSLDTDCSNRCSWNEFVAGCRKLHFHGDFAGAWRVLDKDLSGYITLRELDEEANEILLNFRRWSDDEFGNVTSAFNAFVLWTKWDQLRQERLRQEYWEAQWDQRHSVVGVQPISQDLSNFSVDVIPLESDTAQDSGDEENENLESFKQWANQEFGASAFDISDEGTEINYRQFKNACNDFGFQTDTHALFIALDLQGNQKISLRDTKFLDAWEWRLPHESFDDLGDSGMDIHHSYIPQELTEYETPSPGPGSYNIRSPILNFRDPSVKFSGAYSFGRPQPRFPYIDRDCGLYPSPNTYSSNCEGGFVLGKNSWTFSREDRPVIEPQGPPSKTPGPCNYYLPANSGPRVPHVACSPRRVLRAHPLFRNR